jgi:hypothetical protein
MIKYKIETGSKATNMAARLKKEQVYAPLLKGMSCGTCKINTVVNFVPADGNYTFPQIRACCKDFETRITVKLRIPGCI